MAYEQVSCEYHRRVLILYAAYRINPLIREQAYRCNGGNQMGQPCQLKP